MLRQKLNEIAENGNPSSHSRLIDALRAQHPHAIKALVHDTQYGFTCVMHALGIVDDQEYVRMALSCPSDVFASTEFVHFLIDGGYLIEKSPPEPGLLIAYFDNGRVRHIGRMLSDSRVESKWGMGNLYEHELFEVPMSYGSDVRYFAPLPSDQAVKLFAKFALSKGIDVEP